MQAPTVMKMSQGSRKSSNCNPAFDMVALKESLAMAEIKAAASTKGRYRWQGSWQVALLLNFNFRMASKSSAGLEPGGRWLSLLRVSFWQVAGGVTVSGRWRHSFWQTDLPSCYSHCHRGLPQVERILRCPLK